MKTDLVFYIGLVQLLLDHAKPEIIEKCIPALTEIHQDIGLILKAHGVDTR